MIELLDSRNQNLWNEIQAKYNVEFADSLNGEYSCYTQSNNVTFFIDKSRLCKDSFTHEMLHVYMRLKECYIGASLELTIAGNKTLSAIMSKELVDHMGNCLDHVKMLPVYLDLNFDRTKFIQDYHDYKCTKEEISNFKKYYKNRNLINLQAVDSYIGRLVSIFADPNDMFNYSRDLQELKKVDLLLYQIIERLFNHWKEIKIENRNLLDDNYNTVSYNFHENMKKWITHNRIRV